MNITLLTTYLTIGLVVLYLERTLNAWRAETQAKLRLAEIMEKSDRASIYSILEYIFTNFGPDMPLHGILKELENKIDFHFNSNTKLITFNSTKANKLNKNQ
jgi:hypothetical protein